MNSTLLQLVFNLVNYRYHCYKNTTIIVILTKINIALWFLRNITNLFIKSNILLWYHFRDSIITRLNCWNILKKKFKIIDTFKIFVNLSLNFLYKRFDKYFIIWMFDIFVILLNRWNSFQKISKFLLIWYKLMSLRRAFSFESTSS